MTIFDRVKELCKQKGISIVELEEKVGFGRNSFYSWKKNKPSTEKLEQVADFFKVSTDYLLGRTEEKEVKKPYYALTEKDETDIAKKLELMMNDLASESSLSFLGEPMDEEDRELLRISLENTLRMSREMAKKKFTPKKYRK